MPAQNQSFRDPPNTTLTYPELGQMNFTMPLPTLRLRIGTTDTAALMQRAQRWPVNDHSHRLPDYRKSRISISQYEIDDARRVERKEN